MARRVRPLPPLRSRSRRLGALATVTLGALITACTASDGPTAGTTTIPPTPEVVARGSYLVNHVAICGSCHTSRDSGWLGDPERPDQLLAGGNVLETIEPYQRVWVPNITGDLATGLGGWSDEQIVRSIRDGVGRDGHPLLEVMPFRDFRYMSDEDVRAVVAYLRSIPVLPEPHPRTPNDVPLFVRAFSRLSAAIRRPVQGVTAPDRSDRVKYGEYLARLATCADCHSLGKAGPRSPADRYLAGSDLPFPEGGLVYAPNITPDPDTGIGSYSPEQVKRALREGRGLDGRKLAPPMLSVAHAYAGMTDEDLDALVAYLFAQSPVSWRVPGRRLRPETEARLGGP